MSMPLTVHSEYLKKYVKAEELRIGKEICTMIFNTFIKEGYQIKITYSVGEKEQQIYSARTLIKYVFKYNENHTLYVILYKNNRQEGWIILYPASSPDIITNYQINIETQIKPILDHISKYD